MLPFAVPGDEFGDGINAGGNALADRLVDEKRRRGGNVKRVGEPSIGMRTRNSAPSIHFAVSPYCSAPSAIATLPVRSTSKCSFSACGVAARILK